MDGPPRRRDRSHLPPRAAAGECADRWLLQRRGAGQRGRLAIAGPDPTDVPKVGPGPGARTQLPVSRSNYVNEIHILSTDAATLFALLNPLGMLPPEPGGPALVGTAGVPDGAGAHTAVPLHGYGDAGFLWHQPGLVPHGRRHPAAHDRRPDRHRRVGEAGSEASLTGVDSAFSTATPYR